MTTQPTHPPMHPTQWTVTNVVPVGWMRQFRYMARLFDRIKDVEGNVVECGLGEGNTFAMLAYFVGSEPRTKPRFLVGFDSFEGWPEPSPYDMSPRNPQKGEWKVSKKSVVLRLEESGIYKAFTEVYIRYITIVEGFLEDTLPRFDAPIAFLHLDVDLYPSYRDCLVHLFPKVAQGGVVLFDEYREFPESYGGAEKWPGATRAIDEYFAPFPYKIQHDAEAGKYFIVKE